MRSRLTASFIDVFLAEDVMDLSRGKCFYFQEEYHDPLLRDINDLLERKILVKENFGGRSTSYQICLL